MSLENEYESSLLILDKSAEGRYLRARVPEIAQRILACFLKRTEENSIVKTALSCLDQATVLNILEKNLILLCGRILLVARDFDALDPVVKLEKIIDFLRILKEEEERWDCDFEEKSEHLHDKESRRKRRKLCLIHEHHHHMEDKLFAEKALTRCLQIVLPQGTSSLFLPPMVQIFLSKDFFDVWLLKHIDSLMDAVHGREWKEALLFRIVAYLFQDVFIKIPSIPLKESQVSADLFESVTILSGWVLSLLARVEPIMQYIPREEVARLVCDRITPLLHSFSFERGILSSIPYFLSDRFIGNNLDTLVDSVTGDPKSVLFLLKKLVSLKGDLVDVKATPTLGSILALSVKSALVEHALQEKAASLVYHEVPLRIFNRTHLFVLSRFFDRAIYRFFIKQQ